MLPPVHSPPISQVHRRTLHDDNRGVAEPLAEPGQFGTGLIIRGRHRVIVDTISKSTSLHRTLGEHLMLKPYPIFVPDPSDPKAYQDKYITSVSAADLATNSVLNVLFFTLLQYTFLNSEQLPSNVHLLTMEVMDKDSYLFRFENFMENGGTASLSFTVCELSVFH